jgi:Fungal protein kinase
MYDKLNGDCGVLNDYDLAHLHGRQRSSDTECTGTVPFMALDLLRLSKDAKDSKIARLYRHDCESFVWALLWICCRYDGGKVIRNAPFSELNTNDFRKCLVKKYCIMHFYLDFEPTTSYKRFGRAVLELLSLPVFQLGSKTRRDNFKREVYGLEPQDPTEPTIKEVFEDCRNALEATGFKGTL